LFERFVEPARQVIVPAQDEARRLGHGWIGTEHLLLGLLRVDDAIPAQVLESFGFTLDGVRGEVARIIGDSDEPTSGNMPFTPRSKKVLQLALREALALDQNFIAPEHILLGLVREGEGVAARILRDRADDLTIREAVTAAISGGKYVPWKPPADELTLRNYIAAAYRALDAAKRIAVERQEHQRAAALRDIARQLLDVHGGTVGPDDAE
jgi:ATP-dependent Clp protease ATP-binding subunit ClpA